MGTTGGLGFGLGLGAVWTLGFAVGTGLGFAVGFTLGFAEGTGLGSGVTSLGGAWAGDEVCPSSCSLKASWTMSAASCASDDASMTSPGEATTSSIVEVAKISARSATNDATTSSRAVFTGFGLVT